MRKKVISSIIVVVILASIFSGCVEEKMPESTDQKSARDEWQPHIPSYKQPDIPDHGGAIDHAMDISEGVSQVGETHNAHMNQLVNDITANNDRIEQWSKEHDARIDELGNKMIEQSARIDRWSKEHDDRITELNSKIIEQNVNIDELVKDISAQNVKICEEVRILQANINNIAAQNADITKQMEEYNARIDGHTKKIEAQNDCIDQWSKDYNEHLKGLEGDIEARNAVIYEAVAQAQEHIDKLNWLTNALLEDVIHMWEDMAIGVIAGPSPISDIIEDGIRKVLKIEQREYNFEILGELAKYPGRVSKLMFTANYIIIDQAALTNLQEHIPKVEKIAEITVQSVDNVNLYVYKQNEYVIIYAEKITEIIITIIKRYALI